MRVLGIDFGGKKIGLAIASGKIALPFGNIRNNKKTLVKLKKICKEEEIKGLILGLPLNLDGTEGEMVKKVKDFGEELEKETGLKVDFWDERLTSREAKKQLKAKKDEDSGAASLMLQSYLDNVKLRKEVCSV